MIYSADRGHRSFIDKLKPIKERGNRPLIVPWLRRESIKNDEFLQDRSGLVNVSCFFLKRIDFYWAPFIPD